MTNVQIFNITCDSFDILISLILFVSLFLEDSSDRKLKRYFSFVIIMNIGMSLFDMPEWFSAHTTDKLHYNLLLYGTAAYFISFSLLVMGFFLYEQTYVQQTMQLNSLVLWIMRALVITAFLLNVATLFTGHLFWVDANNGYHRGVLYPVLVVIYLLQSCLCLYVPIKCRRFLRTKEMVFFIAYSLFPMIALLLQALFHGFAYQNIAITLVLMLAYINVQTELSFQNQQQQADMLTYALVESIEAKDQYTKGHSARVAAYTQEIAWRMGYNANQLRTIFYIGLLHDVGKIGIPDAIINKNGRLTDEEHDLIKSHPNIGASILRGLPDLAEGAKYHHERYDGRGYPEGLAGHKIPESARIIAVADAYDAMTSNRSYRSIMSQKDVRTQIIRGMGTQFDPRIADIMVDIIDGDKEYKLRQHTASETPSPNNPFGPHTAQGAFTTPSQPKF